MTKRKRKISVFIASPGDLSAERRAFRDAIDQLNVGFGDGAKVEFEPLGWEDTLASTGRRNQSVINEEIDECDVFILAMYRRWGQEAPDAEIYSSYTEEEFHRALERWKKKGKPEIFVFFKRVDAASEADAGPQLKKVIDFRKQLEKTRQILYRYFDDENSFMNEVDHHLRAYAKGELPKVSDQLDIVVLPVAALAEVEKARAAAVHEANQARIAQDKTEKAKLEVEALHLEMAEDAARLSKEGKIEFAREKFSKLVEETTELRILFLAFEFFYRTGDLGSAFSVLTKWLNVAGPENKSAEVAGAYGNLGILYQIRGDLDRAEEMYWHSLEIDVALGRKEGMARAYGNLGILYQIRGDLDRAEEMCRKSLEIDEALGLKDGIADNCGNLGILYKTRGDLDRAEEMHRKSLEIDEALGRKEAMASDYTNLGNLYQIRGDLDRAEETYRKSLEIDEALARKEGMASAYGNLGVLYQIRGDLDRAEETYRKSLEINAALGLKEGMANQYGNLGNLYQIRGDLDRAEELCRKSLEIDEALGRKGGMAIDYGNLGSLYKIRGDMDRAEEMYRKSLALLRAIGSPKADELAELLRNLRSGGPTNTDPQK